MIICFLMIFTIVQFYNIYLPSNNNVSASSTWIESDWSASESYSYENSMGIDTLSTIGAVKLSHEPDLYITDGLNDRIVRTKMGGDGWINFGTGGNGSEEFIEPFGIFLNINNEDLYITDSTNHRVVKTTMNGEGWVSYGGFGGFENQFTYPRGISFDRNTEFIYVVDSSNNRIVRTKIDGSVWKSLGIEGDGTGQFKYPYGISHDRVTNYLFVADKSNNRIVKMKMDGSGWTTFGSYGFGENYFRNPTGIFYDKNTAYIYVTDRDNCRIVRTKIDGSDWASYGIEGDGVGQFKNPNGIAYDSKTDLIYVVDTHNNRIVKTNMDGTCWTSFGTFGHGRNEFWLPSGIAIGENRSYISTGYLSSKIFNCGSLTNYDNLNWVCNEPKNTEIKFQLRTGHDAYYILYQDFVGPDGTGNTYYTNSGASIWSGHRSDQYLQYKVYLSTNDQTVTPTLNEVKITYNTLSDKPTLITPQQNIWINDNTPEFSWNFSDKESNSQYGFQWQAAVNESFDSIEYDSGEIISSKTSYIPNFTINDGVYFWRVRTQDTDEDWGPYSDTWNLYIDATPPNHFVPIIDPEGWTSKNQFLVLFSTTDDTTEIDHYEIKLSDAEFFVQESPYFFTLEVDGKYNLTIRAYDKVGNYIDLKAEILLDRKTPKIEHQQITSWKANMEIQFRVNVTDEHSGIHQVNFYFKEKENNNYSKKVMNNIEDTYFITISADKVTSNLEYYIEAIDNSTPSNKKYYGKDGEMMIKPTPKSDIDIIIGTEESNNKDGKEVKDSSILFLLLIIVIIIIFAIIFLIMLKKRHKPPINKQYPKQESQSRQQYNYYPQNQTQRIYYQDQTYPPQNNIKSGAPNNYYDPKRRY